MVSCGHLEDGGLVFRCCCPAQSSQSQDHGASTSELGSARGSARTRRV